MFMKILSILFGSFFIVVAVLGYQFQESLMKNGVRAKAKVVSEKYYQSGKNHGYNLELRWKLKNGKNVTEYTSSFVSCKGQTLPIAYNPKNPAELVFADENAVLPLLLGTLFGTCTIFFGLSSDSSDSDKRKQQRSSPEFCSCKDAGFIY